MIAETNHNIDLLLDPSAIDILKAAADEHAVFRDLADTTGPVDLVGATDDIRVRQELDTTVSYTGMTVLQEYATDDTVDDDLQKLCQALVEVAEPCDEGSLLMELDSDGEWNEVHAFDPDADLGDELDEMDDEFDEGRADEFSGALERFIEDHRDANAR